VATRRHRFSFAPGDYLQERYRWHGCAGGAGHRAGLCLASAHATVTGSGRGLLRYDHDVYVFLLLLGRFFEFSMPASEPSSSAGRLNPILPATARRIPETGASQTIVVPVLDLQPGDRILILPGETVPADGVIRTGSSTLDESLLTGEFMPQSVSRVMMLLAAASTSKAHCRSKSHV
jgi:cation transport ATPase